MIITLTLNPSIDRTLDLSSRLERGEVLRTPKRAVDVPAGKGVNVTRVLLAAGTASHAIVAADTDDPFVQQLAALDVPFTAIPTGAPVRCNIALTEPDGTTTKINEPGSPLSVAAIDATLTAVRQHAAHASWLVIAGSLPSTTAPSVLARVIETAREANAAIKICADTSGQALETVTSLPTPVDLIKPNDEELAELLAARPFDDVDSAIAAATTMIGTRSNAVLLTLGGDGAALITAEGVWRAAPPPTVVRSTVGAGDASLAGYLHAETAHRSPADCLRQAVASGSAAAALPGTTIPTLAQADADAVVATEGLLRRTP
ncbi:1-phosphofructokinase family hexose kinase [Humidisolicoccus flavus]|uniref:1-phosphofructokinase family hexose kinase n=1 Tax=Humidisolicoccus flavus TaxID=3111414 RepID=UPI003255CAAC